MKLTLIQRLRNIWKWSAIEPKTPLTAFSGIDNLPIHSPQKQMASIIKRKLMSVDEEVEDILKE